jgi:PilZ domain
MVCCLRATAPRAATGEGHKLEVNVSALNIEDVPLSASTEALGIIFGRFMLPDMSEHPCQVVDVTIDGATFMSAKISPRGQTLVAYLDEIGRVEAISAGPVPGGFRINFSLQGARLERLQQRIQWLLERETGVAESRRHSRYEPSEKVSQIVLPDGRVYNCEVIDISISGAAIKTEVMPSVGTFVMLGKMRARVVRYLETGVAVEFVKHLASAQLPPMSEPPL